MEPPTPSDTYFVKEGIGGSTNFTVPVKRVVGEVGDSGTLMSPQEIVANGVVSEYAAIRILVYFKNQCAPVTHCFIDGLPGFLVCGVCEPILLRPVRAQDGRALRSGYVGAATDSEPPPPEPPRFFLNGTEVNSEPGSVVAADDGGTWRYIVIKVSIGQVRFGRRNVGNLPTAGENNIEIRTSQTIRVAWAAISFKAMAPVIMIHGNNSCGNFFAGDWNCDGTLDVSPEQAFIRPFQQQKIPFDNSINMQTDFISNNAQDLSTKIPAIAAEFGANHVNLVAHSKGGLNSRDFMARLLPPEFGVYTLITLSTPHHGSVGADYVLDAQGAKAVESDSTVRTLAAQKIEPDRGKEDLRVSKVEEFNQKNLSKLPRELPGSETAAEGPFTVSYFSLAADANLDNSVNPITGNPTIQDNEIEGTGYQGTLYGSYAMQITYRMMGEVAETLKVERTNIFGKTVWAVKEVPTESFQLNDFLVTVNSANLPGSTAVPYLKANHATISKASVAERVIDLIRSTQPNK